MIPKFDEAEVAAAWNTYNNLKTPEAGDRGYVFKDRETAWKRYTFVRDHRLYELGLITLTDLNMKWYPRVTTESAQMLN